jgi:hypothetical protein
MGRIIHCCLDIAGFLRQAKQEPALASNLFKGLSSSEAIKVLEENLAIGRKVLPFSNDCEGFDYRTGCPGHEKQEVE